MRHEVVFGVKRAISRGYSADLADIRPELPLRTFVPVAAVLSFLLAINRSFPQVDLTDLADRLYDQVRTVGDLIDYVAGVYQAGDG